MRNDIIIFGAVLVLFTVIVLAQQMPTLSSVEVSKNCKTITYDVYTLKEPVMGWIDVCNKSCAKSWQPVSYADVTYSHNKTICTPALKIDNNPLDVYLQGYNCSINVRGEVVCDSCNDGNCDGKCSPLGGETCCKVNTDKSINCKNGIIEWKEAQISPVEKLRMIS